MLRFKDVYATLKAVSGDSTQSSGTRDADTGPKKESGDGLNMTMNDVMRRVRLLRGYSTDRGASEAEAQNAARLADMLMERYRVAQDAVQPAPPRFHRPVWDYWQRLFIEFDIQLRTFGKRGSADVGRGATAIIRLQSNDWVVQKPSAEGWETVAEGVGLETMRGFLTKNAPRAYSLFKGK